MECSKCKMQWVTINELGTGFNEPIWIDSEYWESIMRGDQYKIQWPYDILTVDDETRPMFKY